MGRIEMSILIKNATIIPMDMPNHVIEKGCIGIREDCIAFIAEKNEIPPDFQANKVIDGNGKVVLPGFVNAHTHCPMIFFRGYSDDVPLQKWLFERIFPVEDKLTAEDAYWGTLLSIAEMLKNGVTAFADQYFFMDAVAKAVEETGIKANLSRGLQCFTNDFDPRTDYRLKEGEELFRKWHGKGNGRIQVWIGPHSVYTCTPPYLEQSLRLASDLGTGIHIHLAENRKEVDECLNKYGKTPVAHCAAIGMFNLPLLAAHCVHLTEEDQVLLAQDNITVVHNPGSNLKLGSGIAPIPDLQKKQINIALGTDGPASNNNLNLLEEISLAALLHKGITEDPTTIPAWDALKMATVNGARGIGFINSGMLVSGNKADLVIFDLEKIHHMPRHNVIANLVYSGASADIDTVIVDGKILLENGTLLTIDEEMVIAKVEECLQRLFA